MHGARGPASLLPAVIRTLICTLSQIAALERRRAYAAAAALLRLLLHAPFCAGRCDLRYQVAFRLAVTPSPHDAASPP